MTISVCHFSPGTSKWNKVEHRLLSAISQDWRGVGEAEMQSHIVRPYVLHGEWNYTIFPRLRLPEEPVIAPRVLRTVIETSRRSPSPTPSRPLGD